VNNSNLKKKRNIYVNSSLTAPGNLQFNDAGFGISFTHAGLTSLVPGGNFTQTLPALTAALTDTISSGTATMDHIAQLVRDVRIDYCGECVRCGDD